MTFVTGDGGRRVHLPRPDRAKPHRLEVRDRRPPEERDGAPSFGPDIAVLLDGVPICWQSLELNLDVVDFPRCTLTIAAEEVEVDAHLVLALAAEVEDQEGTVVLPRRREA